MDQNELNKAKSAEQALNKVSPSFCSVKWKHATLNLGSGFVKSCCHLPFRSFEPANLMNGQQLHETEVDRREREQMLQGQRPKSCSYCWWLEDQGHLSDRIVWSSKSWMSSYTEGLGELATSSAQNPSWIELNFSNVCNLKCSYCSPIFSTKWLQEIKEQGEYPTSPSHNHLTYLRQHGLQEDFDNTQMMEQFWPWFESVYSDVQLLKITGGEPFLTPHTFKLLEWVLKNPNEKMNLSINSNLSVPKTVWEKFISLVTQIQGHKRVGQFYLHPSIDCYGHRAEYIRFGLDFKLFQENVEDYLEKSGGHLVFICTINNLALGGLKELWQYLLRLKQKYGERGQWISITSEVLMGPEWQNINILPESFQNFLVETLQFAQQNTGDLLTQFSSFEIQGLLRALDLMRAPQKNLKTAQKNFYQFFMTHDRRRGTNLIETFPEMESFWKHCKSLVLDEGL